MLEEEITNLIILFIANFNNPFKRSLINIKTNL